MVTSYKTEIKPNEDQINKIKRTIGTCRYIYNFYLSTQKERYASGEKLQTAMDFSKWLNNIYLPNHSELTWIKEVSSKSIKQSIENAYGAYKNFFKRKKGFPKYKKKGKSDVKMYFVKTDDRCKIFCERHRIKIPTIGWIRLKEKGYIPTTKSGMVIKSGYVSECAGRYYVSVNVETYNSIDMNHSEQGMGIDLGIKDLAICSDGHIYKNINKTIKLKRIEKKLKREQRSLSRRLHNKKEGGTAQKNIQKQTRNIQKIHQRLVNIRTDYINKAIAEIVKTKPSYIAIEDLNVSGMMKNRHLSKAISQQKLYDFRVKLIYKCHQKGIELRLVDRWYPSSKICNCCGKIKKNLKLSDRVYKCECGYVEDRDYNASLNLRDCKDYKIA